MKATILRALALTAALTLLSGQSLADLYRSEPIVKPGGFSCADINPLLSSVSIGGQGLIPGMSYPVAVEGQSFTVFSDAIDTLSFGDPDPESSPSPLDADQPINYVILQTLSNSFVIQYEPGGVIYDVDVSAPALGGFPAFLFGAEFCYGKDEQPNIAPTAPQCSSPDALGEAASAVCPDEGDLLVLLVNPDEKTFGFQELSSGERGSLFCNCSTPLPGCDPNLDESDKPRRLGETVCPGPTRPTRAKEPEVIMEFRADPYACAVFGNVRYCWPY